MSQMSRQKGRSWEWAVSRRVSLWWTGDASDSAFAPTAASGASSLEYHQGDIAPVAHRADCLLRSYIIECKHIKAVSWPGFIYNTQLAKDGLHKYYQQALAASERYGQRPIVVFRENFRPPMVMWSASTRLNWFDRMLVDGRRRPDNPMVTIRSYRFDELESVLESSDPKKLMEQSK